MSARGENGRKLLFLATLRRWTAPGGRWAHGQWFSTTAHHKRSEREGVNPLKLDMRTDRSAHPRGLATGEDEGGV